MSNSYEQFGAAMREMGAHARSALYAFNRAMGILQEQLEALWEAMSSFIAQTLETMISIIKDTAQAVVWMWRFKQTARRNRQYALTLSKSGRLEKRRRRL